MVRRQETTIAAPLLAWFERHGRKDLPWQRRPTPYRVWVSEIMLQQTQVVTVIPYFERFMERFPTVQALAEAPLDEVLHLWSGLGYYARARNLHRAAGLMVERHSGRFPRTLEEAMDLPGIGRSTAGAILSLACKQRHAILDGNVKRVLTRYCGIDGFPGLPAVTERLWALAEQHTPQKRVDEYTQAIMDLGATLCTRSKPACERCPVAAGCQARATNRQHVLPAPRPRTAKPLKHTHMLIAVREGRFVFLERRPVKGLWGGLWGLPQFETSEAAQLWCSNRFGMKKVAPQVGAVLRHAFTHFDLDIEPWLVECGKIKAVAESDGVLWYDLHKPARLGMAAPTKILIDRHVRAKQGNFEFAERKRA